MALPGSARTASLGELPFSLRADDLWTTGERILQEARQRLDGLVAAATASSVAELLVPLDKILVVVRNVGSHGGLLFQVHPDPEAREAARRLSESADRFVNEFRLNRPAYERIRAIDLTGADDTTRLAVRNILREMRRAGVELPAEGREKVLALANRLDRLSNEFSANIASGERAIDVEGPQSLRGLPTDYVSAHPPGPAGTIRLTTRYPDCFPVLSYADDPEIRRRMLLAHLNVAYPENPPVLQQILETRQELVTLLGYDNFAQFVVEDKMSGTPEVVTKFLDRIAALLRAPARQDLERYLARKRRDLPSAERLEDWDARFWTAAGYYDTKIRTEEYGTDLRRLREYLPYTAVRDGLFELCRELFGLEFRRNGSVAVWHPTVETYDVIRNGTPIGRCYFDLVPRPGKYNHAAQFNVRVGLSTDDLPQGALICNFLDAQTPVDQVRMEYRDVVVFFHEFGHLIHHMLSGHGPWLYTSMDCIEWDFIEAPSQLFEEWARDPATLARFARNPDTGETIPREMVAQLKESDALGRAASMLRQVALATLSLEIHRRDPEEVDGSALFSEVFRERTGSPLNPEYHPIASFGHLTGYSAIYYTYLWSAVIARDLLTPFAAKGTLTDRECADRYASEVLAPGGSRPAAELVRRYLGREYSFEAFQRWVLEGTQAT